MRPVWHRLGKLYSSEVPEGYESDETGVLGNSAENAEWVGEPSVPLGGDSFINNGLFSKLAPKLTLTPRLVRKARFPSN